MKVSMMPRAVALVLLSGLASQGIASGLSDRFSFADARDDLSVSDQAKVNAATRLTTDFSVAEIFESNSGGAATSYKRVDKNAFSHPSQNLDIDERLTFHLGDALFGKLWVTPPSSTHASDGLGPLYNARSCQSCHINDGRGRPPEDENRALSMLLRLARNPATEIEKRQLASLKIPKLSDPVYGNQLQNQAVPGLQAEGRLTITYEENQIKLSGGETVALRQPRYEIANLGYGPMHQDTTISPRIAPQMIGMGLIQAIHPTDIQLNADPVDQDNDGISGRMALVRDKETDKLVLGRFGWKAASQSIRSQTASAFANDIGISTPDIPKHYGDCTNSQKPCLDQPNGVQKKIGDTEAPEPVMELTTFYSENLAVPARRNVGDSDVLAGKKVFYNIGCTGCHIPKFVTRQNAKHKAHQFQLIWPYSDFLLHDMGNGLADGQQVGRASGREWRTPPLWGIGLTKAVSGHTFFLHDGRARTLTEAILWHGGEATAARNKFAKLSKTQRYNLIKFLGSL